jgi:hypothetical protein
MRRWLPRSDERLSHSSALPDDRAGDRAISQTRAARDPYADWRSRYSGTTLRRYVTSTVKGILGIDPPK